MAERRTLTLACLDDIIAEVDYLLAGHATVGNWSLGQICNHLSTAFKLVSDGGPQRAPRPGSDAMRVRFFELGHFPEGAKVPSSVFVPAEGLDDREQAERLAKEVRRFADSAGPFASHPLLGTLTKDEWIRFHCMHAAHHLGFAVPHPD